MVKSFREGGSGWIRASSDSHGCVLGSRTSGAEAGVIGIEGKFKSNPVSFGIL